MLTPNTFQPETGAESQWTRAPQDGAVELWLAIVAHETSEMLEILVLDSERLGLVGRPWANEPGWLEYEFSFNGLEDVLGVRGHTVRNMHHAQWLLKNGIAPGQPFRARLYQPVWTTDYYGESDCTNPAPDVLAVVPWSKERAIAAWDHWLSLEPVWRAAYDKRHTEWLALHRERGRAA